MELVKYTPFIALATSHDQDSAGNMQGDVNYFSPGTQGHCFVERKGISLKCLTEGFLSACKSKAVFNVR